MGSYWSAPAPDFSLVPCAVLLFDKNRGKPGGASYGVRYMCNGFSASELQSCLHSMYMPAPHQTFQYWQSNADDKNHTCFPLRHEHDYRMLEMYLRKVYETRSRTGPTRQAEVGCFRFHIY